ncbi:putative transcription factor & chromatin remodeling ARID-HMG family [Dioscorea sansibarensis]
MTQEVVAEKNLVGKQLIDKGKQLVLPESGSTQVGQMDSATQAKYQPYPKPLATYESVVSDRKLFMETLEKLHLMMGTKFMVPTVAGKVLDLHQLFVEVTTRGGMEKVIRDRRWRDVVASFNFPSTATNASFVLRKYYMSLLYHYEQIYLFKSQGWNSSPTALLQNPPAPLMSPGKFGEPYIETEPAARKRKSNDVVAPTDLSRLVGSPVTGVIEGKCEHGYFVSVRVGATNLRGIVYHLPGQDAKKKTSRHWHKKKLRKRDPALPRPNRSGYNFFFAEQHARLKPLYPGKDREIGRMIGDLWNKLTDVEKAVYQEKGVKDKERYQNELEIYMKQFHIGQVIISDAVPIQQCPADTDLTTVDKDSKIGTDNSDNSTSDGSDNSEGKNLNINSETEMAQ